MFGTNPLYKFAILLLTYLIEYQHFVDRVSRVFRPTLYTRNGFLREWSCNS